MVFRNGLLLPNPHSSGDDYTRAPPTTYPAIAAGAAGSASTSGFVTSYAALNARRFEAKRKPPMAHQLFETAGEAAKAPCSHYANFSTSFGVAITKVHLIKRQTVGDYAAQHARSRSSFTLSNGREICRLGHPRRYSANLRLSRFTRQRQQPRGVRHWRDITTGSLPATPSGSTKCTCSCAGSAPTPNTISFAPATSNTPLPSTDPGYGNP